MTSQPPPACDVTLAGPDPTDPDALISSARGHVRAAQHAPGREAFEADVRDAQDALRALADLWRHDTVGARRALSAVEHLTRAAETASPEIRDERLEAARWAIAMCDVHRAAVARDRILRGRVTLR